MARQVGRRLAAERTSLGITQAQLAQAMGVTPGRVSQIERGGPATIDTTARYITALGGQLDLVASLRGAPVIIATTAGPGRAGRDQGRDSATDADRPASGAHGQPGRQ